MQGVVASFSHRWLLQKRAPAKALFSKSITVLSHKILPSTPWCNVDLKDVYNIKYKTLLKSQRI
jgi:hypothetical protein